MAIAVLVIVILIAAVNVYLDTYDYNKLKPLIARMVEDATGRKLSRWIFYWYRRQESLACWNFLRNCG